MDLRATTGNGRVRKFIASFYRPEPVSEILRRTKRRGTRLGVELLETRDVMTVAISGSVFQAFDVVNPVNTSPNPGVPVVGAKVSIDNGAAIQTTGADGLFSFAGLAAGSHTVTVAPPAGFIGFSAQSLKYTLVIPDGAEFTNLNFALTPTTAALAQNIFERVLDRSADAAGLQAMVQQLNQGKSVGLVLANLLKTTEFQTVVAPLANFLSSMFPDQPIDSGLLRHGVQLQNLGVPQDAVVLELLYSPSLVKAFGDTSKLSNPDFVKFLYQRLLNMKPSASQLNAYVTKLTNGTINRGDVILKIVNSSLFRSRRSSAPIRLGISMAYLGVLGRDPSAAEFKLWFNRKKSVATVANFLRGTNEFKKLKGFTDTFLADVQAYQIADPVPELSRLRLYNPATRAFDLPVTANSLTSAVATPVNLYFVAHGWAPGFDDTVFLNSTPGNPLKWWETLQFPGGTPPSPDSPWFFGGVNQISVEGLAQAIVDADPMARVIAYSWIDESATPLPGTVGLQDLTPLLYAGQSEAYTQRNGLRLAKAIEDALAPSFFANHGLIHLMGHSHGSKVATVAALALQEAGVPVSQLTLFESPEGGPSPLVEGLQFPPLHLPGLGGAQNFLWYYLQEMNLSKTPVAGRIPVPPVDGKFATFVDNYFSVDGFGSPLGGYPLLDSVVDVKLHAEILYPLPTSTSDPDFAEKVMATVFGSHDYPPAWYAQASLQGAPPPNALGWSPLINPNAAAGLNGLYEQTWTQNIFSEQFDLTAAGVTPPSTTPVFTPLLYARQYTVGATTDTGSAISLDVSAASPTSVLAMTFNPGAATSGIPGNGMDFKIEFSGVDPGEQVELVVWIRGQAAADAPLAGINGGTLGYLSIPLFVMGGTDAGAAPQSATISLDGFLSAVQSAPILGPFSAAQIPTLGFSLIGAGGANASVTISNMRQFTDGLLP